MGRVQAIRGVKGLMWGLGSCTLGAGVVAAVSGATGPMAQTAFVIAGYGAAITTLSVLLGKRVAE